MYPFVKKYILHTAVVCLFVFWAQTCVVAQTSDNASRENTVEMGLAEAVLLAVRNNRTIENAYLRRVVQKYSLRVAGDEFVPNVDISGNLTFNENWNRTILEKGSDKQRSQDRRRGISAAVTERLPTGAQFTFSWTHNSSDMNLDFTKPDPRSSASSWRIDVTQPLLKGGGIDVNMASLRTAHISEKLNILNLKSTLISTVTGVISSYRSFMQAGRQAQISKSSLERSKKLVEKNKLLIKAGRMASMELVQAEADVARNELSYQQALNNLDNARLNLINILDIDKRTMIVPIEEVKIESLTPDLDECLEIAYRNRPDYLNSLLTRDTYEINLVVAKNNRLWNLDLTSHYAFDKQLNRLSSDTDREDWGVGLSMQIPLYGDLTRGQQVVNAKVALQQHAISHRELNETIAIEIQDAIRDINIKLVQVQLAQQSRKLSEKKLAIEQEKLNLGRTTNFQLVTFQNDLVSAQTSELNAKIDYLNALTQLDQKLGTTLDTWKIEFKTERASSVQ